MTKDIMKKKTVITSKSPKTLINDENAYIASFYVDGAIDQQSNIHSTPWSTLQAAHDAAQAYADLVNSPTGWYGGDQWTDSEPLYDSAHPGVRYGVLIGLLSETYDQGCPHAPTGTVLEVNTGEPGDWENLSVKERSSGSVSV